MRDVVLEDALLCRPGDAIGRRSMRPCGFVFAAASNEAPPTFRTSGQRGLNHATTRRLKRFTRPSEAYPTKPVLRRCAGRPTLRATAAGHPGDFGATLAGRKWQRRRRTVTARLIAPHRSWQELLDRAARVPQRARAAQRPGARVWRNDPQSGTGREATARLAKPMRMRMRSPRSSGRGSSACGAAELRRHAAQG